MYTLADSPATAPQLDSLDGNSLAALGVGGLGVVLLAVLVMLVKTGGHAKVQHKFKGLHAVLLAYAAEVLLNAAGGIWDWPGAFFHTVLTAITTNPKVHVSVAVVAFVILSFVFLRNHKPKRGAWTGFLAAVAFRMAGGWFLYPATIIASGVASLGVR